MGAIVDEPRFHGHLTGRQNLKILAAARGGDAGTQIGPALDRTRLTQRADDKVSAYSMGMRQRLGLAACLLADPLLLILDEPMNGLDPAGMHEMRDMLRSLTGEGRTIVLSSHLLDEVERTCDQVAIVDHGKVIRQGPIGELTEGAGVAVEVQCSDPPAAARALGQPAIASRVTLTEGGLTVTLAAGPAQRAGRRHQPPPGRGRDLRLRPAPDARPAGGLVPVRDKPLRRRTVTEHSLAIGGRGSWVPPWPLISAKFLELGKRRVLMTVTVAFTIALPVIFYGIRLTYHLSDPARYAPAGAPDAFATAGTVMDEFGFIIATALGATAGTADLTDGMFRHLVITGRSRLALYLARIPAGLSILLPLAAAGFAVACLVTAFLGSPEPASAVTVSPGDMIRSGLWLELDLLIGFTVGLGLGSLMGQRTVPVILLIVLEIIITPALADHALPHFINGERLVIGVAMDQLKPAALAGGTTIGPGGGPRVPHLPPMPTWAMITVIAGWIVGWSAIGAWKMATRDA